MMLEDVMVHLSKPFEPEDVSWKPQATTKDNTRALAIAYADPRAYQDRLNEVVPGDWSDEYEVYEGGTVVLCKLTVCGVTRCDIGEAPAVDQNTACSALAQAFKRAATKFGLGRYLYSLESQWVDYDAKHKRITEAGERRLRNALVGAKIDKPKPKKQGKELLRSEPRIDTDDHTTDDHTTSEYDSTAFWSLYNDRAKGLGVERSVAAKIAATYSEAGEWGPAYSALTDVIDSLD